MAGLTLNGAYTYARYRFVEEPEGSGLDGHRLPGVPEHFWRFGLRAGLPSGLYLDADHTLSSSVAWPTSNTPEGIVDSWGAGVTNARLGWQGDVGAVQLSPFLGVNNLWDRQYVGSVTLNGAVRPGVGAVAAAGDVHRDGGRVSGSGSRRHPERSEGSCAAPGRDPSLRSG